MNDDTPSNAAQDHEPDAAVAHTDEPWKQTIKRLGAAGPFAIVCVTVPALAGFLLLGFSQTVADWLRSLGSDGVYVYSVAFAILSGTALMPTYAPAVVGGYTFGFITGSRAALAGFLGASLVGYLASRIASRDRVLVVLSEHPKLAAVHRELLGSGAWKTLGIVTLVRLNSPFALTNLVLAATRVPLSIYIVGTLVGLTPRTLAAVYIGSTLTDLSDGPHMPLWLKIAGIAIVVVVVMVIGHLANQAIARVANVGEPAAAPSGE